MNTAVTSGPAVGQLLQTRFPAKHLESALSHFQKMVEAFQKSDWEPTILKSGKFVEAVLKALWAHLGKAVPKSKDFKVDPVIRGLEQSPGSAADDTIRLTIPRACRFIYDVASNRGARHDPDEVDPNQMDATAMVALCSWVLGEMLRYSQKGAIDLAKAAELVASVTQKKFPVIEEVDGRIYFHLRGLSARDVALLTLLHVHPARMNRDELIAAVRRHGSSRANALMGVSRLDRVVDDDGQGNLRLLAPGVREAEQILATAPSKS